MFQAFKKKSVRVLMLKKVSLLTLFEKGKKGFFDTQKSREWGTVYVRDSQPGCFLLRSVHRLWIKHFARDEFG